MEFRHAQQPYGTVILKNATRTEIEVSRYIPTVGFDGTRKTMRVTGEVVDSKFVSLLGGVTITRGRQKYPKGSMYSVDDVTDYEWEYGVKTHVAM